MVNLPAYIQGGTADSYTNALQKTVLTAAGNFRKFTYLMWVKCKISIYIQILIKILSG